MASCKLARPLVVLAVLLALSPSFASADDAPKVSLALYYESLCPFCSRFIVNHLAKIFQDGLIDIVDLELVPYGNAHVKNDTITCQHGQYECLLNTVEACAIDVEPDVNKHFPFINCVEHLVVEYKYLEWQSCFSKTGFDSEVVLDCANGSKGHKLELGYGSKTDSLVPPHRYVPWVVVDGKPLYDDYEDFEAFVCKSYKGEPPKVCTELASVVKGLKTGNHVTYADETSNFMHGEGNQIKIQMVV